MPWNFLVLGLHSQLGYSAGALHVLRLVVVVVLVPWMNHLTLHIGPVFCQIYSKVVFHLALTMGVPQWEVEGSKWNNFGNSGGRWQVGNNQWKVGNNLDWFRPLTALLHYFWIWRRCFSQFPPVDITQIYTTDCFDSIIDHHDGTTCEYSFSINCRYIHISFILF